MREIKFRAWDKKNKKMDYPVITKRYMKLTINGLFRNLRFDNWELMQYTGLKDKKGKEIYEGDIVRDTWGLIAKIVYRRCWFVLEIIKNYEKNPIEKGELLGNHIPDHLEIIGNIYENPELLVGK